MNQFAQGAIIPTLSAFAVILRVLQQQQNKHIMIFTAIGQV